MIEEQATIIKVFDDIAWLDVKSAGCGGCQKSQQCGMNWLPKLSKKRLNYLQADNQINASKGDQLIVAIPEGMLLMSALVVYALPIITMVFLGFLGLIIEQYWAMGEGSVSSLLSIVGLVMGFVFAFYKNKKIAHNNNFRPIILRQVR
jgi:sigma-E factor negative regulatory protein RseC